MTTYSPVPDAPAHEMAMETPVFKRKNTRGAFALAAAVAITLVVSVAVVAGKSKGSLLRSGSSLFASSNQPKGLKSTDSSSSSTDVYIIAEAFCPNCKEHSYLFDTKIMANEDVRSKLNIRMDMLVLEGWDSARDTGECEKGKFDCIAAQYHLAAQKAYPGAGAKWWEFSRCVFKHQPELIAYYYEEGHTSQDKLNEVMQSCADDGGLDYSTIRDKVAAEGQHYLKESYGRTIEYDMPVWIYVNDRYVEYEVDWLSTICASVSDQTDIDSCLSYSSLDGGDLGMKSLSLFEDETKVRVYIVAEAMCPNCKEHSYYFDRLVMTPESTKSSIRDFLEIKLEQMVIDGWDSETNTGICEKGKFDCELSKYQLCGQEVYSDSLKWWDYTRCLYKHQEGMIQYYYDDGKTDMSLMNRVTTSCAAETGLDAESIKTCVDEEGTDLLYGSWKRTGDTSEPVWIYVEGQRIAYHEDWLSAICAAAATKGYDDIEECNFYADVGRK